VKTDVAEDVRGRVLSVGVRGSHSSVVGSGMGLPVVESSVGGGSTAASRGRLSPCAARREASLITSNDASDPTPKPIKPDGIDEQDDCDSQQRSPKQTNADEPEPAFPQVEKERNTGTALTMLETEGISATNSDRAGGSGALFFGELAERLASYESYG